MHIPWLRSTALRVVLATLACGIWLAPATHAAPTTLNLRYHFVAGQILTYRLTDTFDDRVAVPGKPDDVTHQVFSYQAHYLFRHVDPSGNATLTVTLDHDTETVSHKGKVTHTAPSTAQLNALSAACVQEADGTQYSVYRGAYGLNDIGQVPSSPVTVGASWQSRIDNTWVTNARKEVTVKNVLQQVTAGPQGATAVISTTATIPPAAAGGASATTARLLKGSEAGTWRFAVDSGMFLSETLRQDGVSRATVKDAKGTHPQTTTEVSVATMQLLSVGSTAPKPFQPAGPTTSYKSATYGYSLTYPTNWRVASRTGQNFQVSTADGNAAVFVEAVTTNPASASDPQVLARFIEGLGTPEGPISASLDTIRGRQFGVGDALVTTKSNVELQLEVRDTNTPHALLFVVGVTASGLADGSVRLPTFARQVEQVQRVLNSLRVASGSGA